MRKLIENQKKYSQPQRSADTAEEEKKCVKNKDLVKFKHKNCTIKTTLKDDEINPMKEDQKGSKFGLFYA